MTASAPPERIANRTSPGAMSRYAEAFAASEYPAPAVTPAGPRSAAFADVFVTNSFVGLTGSAVLRATAVVEAVTLAAVIAIDQRPVTVQSAAGRYVISAARMSARRACLPSTKNVPWLFDTCTSIPRRTASSV